MRPNPHAEHAELPTTPVVPAGQDALPADKYNPRIVWLFESATNNVPSFKATPRGPLNPICVPNPSDSAAVPDPYNVVTNPVALISRTRLFVTSATYTLPLASTAMSNAAKLAIVPCPSDHAVDPDPASVAVAPDGDTVRTRPPSDRYITPAALNAHRDGEVTVANTPTPSDALLAPDPTKVVTTPAGLMRRTRWLPVSGTYSAPALSWQMPPIVENTACAPVPSAYPTAPDPASTLTAPVAAVHMRTRLDPPSATNTSPFAPITLPTGPFSAALVPTPLLPAPPVAPLPITVVTVRVARLSSRTRLLPLSLISRNWPVGSRVELNGVLKAATLPAPSAKPGVVEPINDTELGSALQLA